MTKIINLKKRLSVDLAKSIEEPLRNYFGLFNIIDKNDSLLYLSDKDNTSDLFFSIVKETYESNGHIIHYSCKPFNNSRKDNLTTVTKLENFIAVLTGWLENVKFYEEDSVLNDPIIRGYTKEFYADFKITDQSADFEGFNYTQQRQLGEFFEKLSRDIETLKDENNPEIIEDLKTEIIDLQKSVTSETKNGIMKKFSSVLAKARKGGFKVCDFILKEFVKDFLTEGAKFAFNYITKNPNKLPEYIEHLTPQLAQVFRA
ncbi:hypothetical protein [Pedobacter cryophilus]|uniref:Uncharacterized protein n=1 Tax=Pedobacter cryophilus TaxID=2571271 RepID=A0A4U1C7Z7_9SPHI|nr:hypothetical protein [Pedobacter cryophilus]TKC00804.1 hypothetical protein FA046_03770 [Pedobacter cryophilus]